MDWSASLDFTGKDVLVTGATDGIGLATAEAFRQRGAKVTVTGTKTADRYDADLSNFAYCRLDVTDPASVGALAGDIEALDVLVNAVGAVAYGSSEFERDTFARIVDVNLTGVMHLCTSLAGALAKRRGAIVNVDSIASDRIARNNPAYSASKAGLKHLNHVLAVKWAKKGIRVNGVGPGFVPTRMTVNQVNDESRKYFEEKVPAGRYGTPEDMAGVILFLASPLAAYVTGESILVDGGLSLIGGF